MSVRKSMCFTGLYFIFKYPAVSHFNILLSNLCIELHNFLLQIQYPTKATSQ